VLSLTNGRGRVRAVVTVARHCGAPVGWSQTGDVGEWAGRHQDHESGAEAHQGGFQKGSWRVLPKEAAGGLHTAAWSPQGAAWIPVAFHQANTTREHPLGAAGGHRIAQRGDTQCKRCHRGDLQGHSGALYALRKSACVSWMGCRRCGHLLPTRLT